MPEYQIIPKRDWGAGGWRDSKTRTTQQGGFIVTDGLCNVMPGACWFMSVEDAEEGIKALEMSEGDANKFWDILKMWETLKRT